MQVDDHSTQDHLSINVNFTMTSCFSFLTKTRPRHPKDGAWAWLVLCYVSLCAVFQGIIFYGFGIIVPVLMADLGENRERISLVGSLRLGMSLFICVFTSKLCERYGCRIVNAIGLLISVVGLILSSLSKSVYPLYFMFSFLVGVGGAGTFTSHFIMLRIYFKKHYSLAAGIRAAGIGIGMVLGPFARYMIDSYGWRNTFRFFAGIFALLIPFSLILDPNVEPCEETATENVMEVKENSNDKHEMKRRKIVLGFLDLSVWTFPEFTICVIGISIGCWGHMTPLIHMIKYSEELGISPTKSSTLFVFFGIATIISRLISGRLCDVSFIKPRYIHQVGIILSGISTILSTFATKYTHLIIFSVFYGIADGAFRTTTNILFMNTVDIPRRASAFGQAYMIVSLTTTAGPPIAGMMADKAGSYTSAFYMAGTVSIVGGSIFFLYLCFFKDRSDRLIREQVVLSNSNDHPLACNGPASTESEATPS